MTDVNILLHPFRGEAPYFETDDQNEWADVAIPPRKQPFLGSSICVSASASQNAYFEKHGVIGRPKLRTSTKQNQRAAPDVGVYAATPVEVATQRSGYPKVYVWLGYLVFALLFGGVIATAITRSPLTEIAVPVGFTLWAVLAYFIRRRDGRRVDA